MGNEHHHQLAATSDSLYCNVLYLLAQSKLFTNQLDLGIKDNDIIETLKKSNRRYPMTKTKAAIEELEALGAIEIVSKRPKQHVITIL